MTIKNKNNGFLEIVTALVITALIGSGLAVTKFFNNQRKGQETSIVKNEKPILGSTNVVQAQAFTLSGSGVTAAQATIPLTSFKLPDASTTIIMANFSAGIGYGTIEPGTSKEEQVSFTGVTQNADGTATLSGVTRGLSFTVPCTANTSFQKAHAGGVKFVLSNTACFYSQFAGIASTNTWSGVQTFNPGMLRYSSNPDFTGSSTASIPDLAYVNSVATSGAANASPIVKGLSYIGTINDGIAASSTREGGIYKVVETGLLRATSSLTTSTVPIANLSQNGRYQIDPSFIATSSNYTWSGTNAFTGAVNVSNTLTNTATTSLVNTTIAGTTSTISSTNFYISSVTTTFSGGTSGLSWERIGKYSLNSAATSVDFIVPARNNYFMLGFFGQLSTSDYIDLRLNGDATGNAHNANFSIDGGASTKGQGSALAFNGTTATTTTSTVTLNITNNSKSFKIISGQGQFGGEGAGGTIAPPTLVSSQGTWASSTQATRFTFKTNGGTATMASGTYIDVYGSKE